MQVLNAESSSKYFDSLVNEREDSAVNVVHGAWLNHSSSLATGDRLQPSSPLDMLVLYRSAADTFRGWSRETRQIVDLMPGGSVVNRPQAALLLQSISDSELAALATSFANHVIRLSEASAAKQDLKYFVELFLRSLHDKRIIDEILAGSIRRHAAQLATPDNW